MRLETTFISVMFSIGIHVIFISLLVMTPPTRKHPAVKLREHFVGTFTEQPVHVVKETISTSPPSCSHPSTLSDTHKSPASTKIPTKPAPLKNTTLKSKPKTHPVPNVEKLVKETVPKEPPLVKTPTKISSAKNQKQPLNHHRNEKLRELAKIANEMSKRLEADNKRLHDPILSKTAVFVSTENDGGVLQSATLIQLLREHLILPLPGILRLQLTISPKGELLQCSVYESETELNKQYVLSKIHEISFEEFIKKYKSSKNISLHIKLVGEP